MSTYRIVIRFEMPAEKLGRATWDRYVHWGIDDVSGLFENMESLEVEALSELIDWQ